MVIEATPGEIIDGNKRFLTLSYRDITVTERVPLYILTLPKEGQEWHMGKIAKKIIQKLRQKLRLSKTERICISVSRPNATSELSPEKLTIESL